MLKEYSFIKDGITYKAVKGGSLINLYNDFGRNYDCFTAEEPVEEPKDLEYHVIDWLFLTKIEELDTDIKAVFELNDIDITDKEVKKIIYRIIDQAGYREKYIIINYNDFDGIEIIGGKHKMLKFYDQDYDWFTVALHKDYNYRIVG